MKRSRHPRTSSRLLVVDDDRIHRRLVVKGLGEIDGVEIHEVEDGIAARDYLAQHPVDVVVTDVMMPRMDGLALIRWAREERKRPIWIILSGLDTFDAAVEAIHLGAFDFLPKPLHIKRLQVSVKNALRHRRLLAEKRRLRRELENKVHQLEGMCRILEEQAEHIRDDLKRAEAIQSALLPQSPPQLPGFMIHSLYRPGHCIGGDLYDVVRANDRYVILYVADASGHGVSAAMLSVLFKQRLQIADPGTGRVLSPGLALEKVSGELFNAITTPGMFVTAAYCVLDLREKKLRCASAGHPPVQVVRENGETVSIRCTGPALGLSRSVSFAQEELELQSGDQLLLYTDGLTDQPSGTALKVSKLIELLTGNGSPGIDLLRRLFREATAGTGVERDDVTMVSVVVRSGASVFDNQAGKDEKKKPRVPAPPPVSILFAEANGKAHISLQGRGTYTQSDAFFEAAFACVDAGQALTVDLSECEYLDSTFLGTLHALVDHAEVAGVRVTLQGVREYVRGLFEELKMDTVISRIAEERTAPPARLQPLQPSEKGKKPDYRMILWAHEILASLSEQNREKFDFVIQTLRRELGEA